MRLALAILLAFAGAPAVAKDILLSPPIDCGADGSTCLIQQYTDTDPGPGHRDFTCGPLSYDGHKGTDFRVPTLADMDAGVTVLSAAPGTVTAVRDGMPDIYASDPNAPDLEGRDCGNGLVINHGGGWETQYCHLKQGSLAVAKGDSVAKGTNLGQIGLSGRTGFSHVHLSVRKNGKVVDPFNPDALNSCGQATRSLWRTIPRYAPGGLLDIGFHSEIPEYAKLKAGFSDPDTLPVDSGALVLWAYMFGGRAGDVVQFKINGPQNWRYETEVSLEKPQAELFRAVGKRIPDMGWAIGRYDGSVTLKRGAQIIDQAEIAVSIGG